MGATRPKPLGVFRYRLLSYTSTWDCSSMLNLRYLPTKVHNFTEKYVSKIYKSGQPHQNVNNLIINTCRFCINRDKWGGYKDEKFQQFTISPLKNA